METQARSVDDEKFIELPEPPAPPEGLKRLTDDIEDFYLNGLENYISKLGEHIRQIQSEETARMVRFTKQLEKLKTKSSKRREDAEEEARQEFQHAIAAIRRKRKQYREMERSALNERRRYLECLEYQKSEQQILRQKLLKLGALPKTEAETKEAHHKSPFGPFSFLFFLFQLGLLLAFLASDFLDYKSEPCTDCNYWHDFVTQNYGHPLALDNTYTFFIHIVVMVIFGFGFLAAWLKKYAYSSLTYSLMTAAFSFQLNYFLMAFWRAVDDGGWGDDIPLTITTFIEAIYGAAAVLVTFGAVLGKISPVELLVMALLETICYSINYFVCILVLDASDPGGGMMIHMFGAFFSLAMTYRLSEIFVNQKTIRSDDLSSNYRSDLFAMLGTAFLYVFFPSFNAALAPNGTQHRAAINTILSLLTSCIFTFIVSRTFRKNLFDMRDVQNATIAGGIALGSAHSLIIVPAASLLIGAVAGTVTVIGFVWVTPFLERISKGKLSDTRGVFSLHGLSGMIAGIAAIVATGITSEHKIYAQPTEDIFDHDIPDQAGYQTAAFFITIGIGFFGGFISSLFVSGFRSATSPGFEAPIPYTDEEQFIIPSNFQRTLKSKTEA